MNSGIRPNFSRSSGSTSRRIAPVRRSSGAAHLGAIAHRRSPCRARAMIFSSPEKAPPQMNRMLVVSTCRNSCCGCLRPPCGGTEATVPSMIFSSACCTPSPDTSRVIEGLSDLRRDLVDLVDIDDAALRPLDVVVGRLQQLQDDVLDILADVAGLGQRRGVGHGERHVDDARQRLRQQRLARAGRPDQQDVGLGDLDVVVLLRRAPAACSGCGPRPRARAWRGPGRSRSRPAPCRSRAASARRRATSRGASCAPHG